MNKMIAIAFAALTASVFADKATFPYEVEMTTRIETNETVSVSDSEASLTGTVTPASDSVAELNLTAVAFTAVDEASWDDFVGDLSGIAMLAIKNTSAGAVWYGYAGGAWVALTGHTPDIAKSYDVNISFDKTAGNKIRYSVRENGGDATSFTALTSGGVEWLAQGVAATQISAVALKGTGSIGSGALASGARGAYANITGVEQVYSYDYSNVVINVNVGDNVYGENLKITLTDGSTTKSIEKEIESGKVNVVDFSDEGLVPGTTYDCVIEVVKSDAPAYTNGDSSAVTLAATADWFGFDQGEFVKATGENVTITDGKFSATDSGDPAVVTPASPSSANSKSTVEITVDYSAAFAETAQYDDAQSALALTENGWKCLIADDTEGPLWIAITNENVSAAAGVYATRAEFDYTDADDETSGWVRFSVKQDDVWYVMHEVGYDDEDWFCLVGTSNKLNGTSFVGGGSVAAIAATYSSTEGIEPTISGSALALAGSTDVKLANVDAGTYDIAQPSGRKYSMKWTDSADKHATINADGQLVVSSGAAANGMDSYNSYALGLDPENADSKPVLDSAQNAKTGALDVKVANVNPKEGVAEVDMSVVEMTSPDGEAEDEYYFIDGTAEIPLPDDVRYYKVKISIKTK